MLALLKSAALKGKGCLLVAKPGDAYRLRMFLDTFGIRAALCHDAMPVKSREHAAQVRSLAWPAVLAVWHIADAMHGWCTAGSVQNSTD